MSKALIAYIPALHEGYINFLKKHVDAELFILGKDLVAESPRMDRDIRAISPDEMKVAIYALGIVKNVTVLNKTDISGVAKKFKKIIMPDEDVSRKIAETYFKGIPVQYDSVFLRWDKQISTAEQTISPNHTISIAEFDREMMKRAFNESTKSSDWWRQIGALIIKDGKPVIVGYNHPLPSDHVHNVLGDPRSNFDAGVSIELSKFIHAEAALIAEAARKGISLEGAHLYVTTFPCPVCAKSVAVSGIKKVFYSKGYSLLDAEDILKTHTISIVCVKMN